MLDYAHLEALLIVEQKGSFEAAAKHVGISASAVSQRIKLLEERIGAILIKRTNPIKMTESGLLLVRHAEAISICEQDLVSRIQLSSKTSSTSKTALKIFVDSDSLSNWFIDALQLESGNDSPFVYNITISEQDTSIDKMKNGLGIAGISTSKEPIQGFKCRFLGDQIFRAVASKNFINTHFANGVNADALLETTALQYSCESMLQQQWIAQALKAHVSFDAHILPDTNAVMNACSKGIGWAVLPASIVDGAIQDGLLEELIPNVVLEKSLYWHFSKIIERPLAKFTNLIVKIAGDNLSQVNNHMKVNNIFIQNKF